MKLSGVASPRAQGQLITRTEIPLERAAPKSPFIIILAQILEEDVFTEVEKVEVVKDYNNYKSNNVINDYKNYIYINQHY